MRRYNESLTFVFHDSFHTSAKTWNDLFPDDDCENVALDTHIYMAWETPKTQIDQFCSMIDFYLNNPDAAEIKYDMWVGEWSLATDECGMWLDGMNDEQEGFPQYPCVYHDCPSSYMPEPYNFDFDREADVLGPIGEHSPNLIKKGQCPYDAGMFDDQEVKQLADCTLDMFNQRLKAQFMWNFRTQQEIKWDYIRAYDAGLLPYTNTFLQ